jgi:hypothetical protein
LTRSTAGKSRRTIAHGLLCILQNIGRKTMTDTTADPFDRLAERLSVIDWQRRITNGRLVLIAGALGHIKPDMSLTLKLTCLTVEARSAASDLILAGLIRDSDTLTPRIARMPKNDHEARLLRVLLGLRRDRDSK